MGIKYGLEEDHKAAGDMLAQIDEDNLSKCPACGQSIKPKPLTNAERQKRWRDRQKEV